MNAQLQKIDHGALKANQLVIIAFNLIAFVLNLPWLAAAVGVIMLVGSLLGVPGFISVYKFALKPLGWVKPDILLDNPEPHRFAQGFGSVVLLLGMLALYFNLSVLGWGLVWLVIALAALNAFGGFCTGCFVYYWLTRFGLPGFNKQPPSGTFPGMRPNGAQ
jgi:hypothetical protein